MKKSLFFLTNNKVELIFIFILLTRLLYAPFLFSISSPEFFIVKIVNVVFAAADFLLILFSKKIKFAISITLFSLGLIAFGLILSLTTKMASGYEFVTLACIPGLFFINYNLQEKKIKRQTRIILHTIFITATFTIVYVRLHNLPPTQLFLPERRIIFIANEFFYSTIALIFLLYGSLLTAITFRHLEKKQEFYQEQLDFIAKHDPLTGLMNRRRTHQIFNLIQNSKNKDYAEYSIAIFDIDNFKKINDTYGHDAGDLILTTFASTVLEDFEDPVKVGRWGGEEFVIIFPTNDESTIYRLEDIRKKLSSKPIIYKEQAIPVSATFGVSSSKKLKNPMEVLADADKMLLIGKQNGKNKVVVSTNF